MKRKITFEYNPTLDTFSIYFNDRYIGHYMLNDKSFAVYIRTRNGEVSCFSLYLPISDNIKSNAEKLIKKFINLITEKGKNDDILGCED